MHEQLMPTENGAASEYLFTIHFFHSWIRLRRSSFLINNEILPPHVVPGVMEEVQSLVHSTLLQFRWNFLHIFTQHETENIHTTDRHKVISREILLVYTLEPPPSNHVFVHSTISIPISLTSFPTAQISIGVYTYAFT